MTLPPHMQKLMEEMADKALEKELFESGVGFLEKPYSRYRFHNGYCVAFQACFELVRPDLEKLIEAMDANQTWSESELYEKELKEKYFGA